MTKTITILVGPPGCGKSTIGKKLTLKSMHAGNRTIYINQDSQGKEHYSLFLKGIADGFDIVVDRMNFNKEQRNRYLEPAKSNGYTTKIMVIHESYNVCMTRMSLRKDHETIQTKESAEKALSFFFKAYERVEESEANIVERVWPNNTKLPAVICDLDGTLCDVEHRKHFVQVEKGQKRNWPAFFEGIAHDGVNQIVADFLGKFKKDAYQIVYCSGRGQEYEGLTKSWLEKNKLWDICEGDLYMRQPGDFRKDDIVKEILLDFEILTRFQPYFILDDRDQVVKMWRKRGYTCLQVANGDF